MYCSKCGNKIEEGAEFCNKCGNKIESGNNMPNIKKEHWIKNTKLGIYISNHKNARTILAVVIVILIFLLYLNITSAWTDLDVLKNFNENDKEGILWNRIKLYGSIILIPFILYYGSKLVEKR